MIILGFCNLKGGVGKTTSCQNIAVALSKLGQKVAVIDMDPQSNLSAGFGITPSPTEPQVFDLLSGDASWDEILHEKEGIDIIPSSLNLVMAELNNEGPVSQDTVLSDALSKVDNDRYDYILIDSPPQLGIFTRNVLAACDKIIVPMDGGYYSLFGLRLLNDSLPVFRDRLNPDLEISGVLMTNYNPRLYIAKQVYKGVKKSFENLLFENYIPQNISLVEASSMGMSIFAYSPKSRGAKCYRDTAKELISRLENSESKSNITREPETASEPEPENLKQSIIDMLPETERAMWISMLSAVNVTREEINIEALRNDFENSDKDRYTFYMLNDEEKSLLPVMNSEQINEPLRCVLKWDENGSAEVYM